MRKCLMYDLSPTHFTLINKVQLIELNEKGMYGVWPASLDSSVPAALLVSVTYPHSLNNLNNSKKHLTHSIFFLPLRSQLSSTTLVQTNLLTVFLNGWRFIHSPATDKRLKPQLSIQAYCCISGMRPKHRSLKTTNKQNNFQEELRELWLPHCTWGIRRSESLSRQAK
jgi:hypothetical protein